MKEEKKEQEIHSERRKEDRGEESGERSKFECRRLDRIRVKIDHLKRSMLNPAAAVAAAAAARHAVSTDSGGDVPRLPSFGAAERAGHYCAQILLIPPPQRRICEGVSE